MPNDSTLLSFFILTIDKMGALMRAKIKLIAGIMLDFLLTYQQVTSSQSLTWGPIWLVLKGLWPKGEGGFLGSLGYQR